MEECHGSDGWQVCEQRGWGHVLRESETGVTFAITRHNHNMRGLRKRGGVLRQTLGDTLGRCGCRKYNSIRWVN